MLEGSLSGEITSGSWIWDGTVYTFIPSSDYNPGEALVLNVTAQDIHKNTNGATFNFTVKADGIPPEVTEVLPTEDEINVSQSAPIVITFSNDVHRDSTSVYVNGSRQGSISVTKSWLDYTLTLSHTTLFQLDETVTVTVNAGDAV